MLEKISITRALSELKLLDKRIRKLIKSSCFIDYTVNSKQNVKDFNPESDLQSVNDLIARRKNIKSAIMKSNATTNVTIGGVTMTVIDAIEMKEGIEYKKLLREKMLIQRRDVLSLIENINIDVDARLDKLLQANFGKESKTKDSETEAISKPFLERNQAVESDPIGINDVYMDLDTEIDEFESEVDFTLSESNSTTFIEV